MALTSTTSDTNLFEDFEDNELDQIFNITDTSNHNLDTSVTEKDDEGSESGGETVYIEPMEEDDDDESLSSQILVSKQIEEDDRRSTGSHDYSRRASIEAFRDDELEFTSYENTDIDDFLTMDMSQEIVATQGFDPEVIETSEVQDVENYGEAELQVVVEEKVPEPVVESKKDDPKPVQVDTQESDSSYALPIILNSTVDDEESDDSQKTIILSDSIVEAVNEEMACPVEIPAESLENNSITSDEPPPLPEVPVEQPKSSIITDPVPSTSKEPEISYLLPDELSETRTISEDHDYLAKKLPMNFNLVVEDTEKLVEKNIDHVILLAASLKAPSDKDKFAENLESLLNHLCLLQDITHINDEEFQVPEKSFYDVPPPPLVFKEESLQIENAEDLVIENMEKELSNIVEVESEVMEVDLVVPKTEMMDDSLIIDPIRFHIENLESFAKEMSEKAENWRKTKETNLAAVHEVLKEGDKEWKSLMLKFECPGDTVDVGTEIDPKMFAKQNRQAKKEILAFMTDSENEAENEDSDDGMRQNIIDMVEASYSDALDSDIEEEMGKKRLIPKTSENNKLPEIEPTKKDSDDDENSNSDSDGSIDRLCNLNNLARKNRDNDRKYEKPPATQKQAKKNSLNVEELVNGAANENGDDSEEETVAPLTKAPATEAEFLQKINEEIKRQLLESSDSDIDDNESAISVNSEAHDSESSDDSDSSIIMDRFLSSLDQNQRIKNGTKLPSIDSGLEEKSPPPKASNVRRRSSAIDRDPLHTPEGSKDDDDDALDLSMFKVATQKVKESEALADLDAELEPDTTKVPNVEDYISLSSESEDENTTEAPARNRGTRKIMSEAELATETKAAQEAEVRREKRLNKMSQNMTQLLSQRRDLENEFVLDYDKKNNQAITVHPDIVKKLKPHQKEGVRFMYNNCYGPIDDIEKYPGSGCILAHCMGLGKTLQLIALLHTIIRYPRLKTNKILVLCPKSTIMNWFEEFERWISTIKKTRKMKVFCYEENMTIKEKTKILVEWYNCGKEVKREPSSQESWLGKTSTGQAGCLLLGYETFRSLVTYKPRRKNARPMDEKEIKHIQDTIEKCLIEPGADMVVCDEGHVIKNSRSGISKAVSQIKTKRRIILTGTPIQNNLNEYYCMVNWIKPSFLGTEKEFNNRYANPIKQGQHKDSTSTEIRQMKRRSFVLHRKLQPFVERKEFTILKDELPKKHEYVVYVPLTEVQTRLYKIYLEQLKSSLGESEKIKGNHLLPDYTYLRKIWTHPRVLESAFETSRKNQNKKTTKMFEKNLDKLIERCDEEDLPDDVFDIGGTKAGVPDKWWDRFLEPEDLDTLVSSYKMQIMIEILRQCNEMGDKCLIFSNFVAVLTVVEHFLKTHLGYLPGHNYYRLDGQTPKAKRHTMITRFNRADNQDVKCFLISARAGGQGINLIGANRVIILDTSWNPAADLQSIFRVYRLGQKKTCYVYRLLAFGTMEEKVYSRSVTKQAMSNRVVDEMQVDRHFSYGELAELYTLTEYDMESRPVPGVPVDSILLNLLRLFPQFIYKFHEHDSLLASNDDEELSEQEKADAWKALEDEEREHNNPNKFNQNPLQGMSSPLSNYTNNFLANYYNNYGNAPNMNMLSQLMFNMDPYYGLLNNLPGLTSPSSKDQGAGSSNPFNNTTNPLMAMNSLVNPHLSGGGITSSSQANFLENLYRSPSASAGPSMFNSSTDELLTGMRQRNSNNFGAVTAARSHPVNGVARTSSKNSTPTPPEPIPIRLTPSAELLRNRQSLPSPSPSSTSSNSSKRVTPQVRQPAKKQAFEEQYVKHFENKTMPVARKESQNVIEIPDDDTSPPPKANPPKTAPSQPTKVVKSANMGIHYPEKQPKGTPIYLPDLPEGTSINKIPKKVTEGVSKPATITTVANKSTVQTLPRPTQSVIRSPTVTRPMAIQRPAVQRSSSGGVQAVVQRPSTSGVQTIQRPSGIRMIVQPKKPPPPSVQTQQIRKVTARGIEVVKPTIKPTVQNIGNVTITPNNLRLAKPPAPTIVRTQQPQPRFVPVASTTNVVKNAVQQITANSRGNTSITPVTRPPSGIPTAAAATASQSIQGWKRKEPPTNAANPAKIVRLNPGQLARK